MLRIIHPYGVILSKGRVVQGTRERQEKSDMSKVAEIWHHDVSLWSASAVTQPFNWGSKGEVSAASFSILSSIKFTTSPYMLSKHLWLCFPSVPRWFGLAHDPCNIPQSQHQLPAKPLGTKLFYVRSWWHIFADIILILSVAPEGPAAADRHAHTTFYDLKCIFFKDLDLICSYLLPYFTDSSYLLLWFTIKTAVYFSP